MEVKEFDVEIKKMSDIVAGIKADVEAKSKDLSGATEKIKGIEEKMKTFVDEKGNLVTQDEIKAFQKEMQDQFDELATKRKESEVKSVKTIDGAIGEFLEGKGDEIMRALKTQNGSYSIPLKEVKTMLLSTSLTGDGVATYSPRQALLPSQKINFRDLVPTFNSPTGLYVFYKETSTTNNIARQTEGSTKGENTYALAEVKVVNQYVAGFTTFSKQMANQLPWMQQVLPRLLMRDFFKKENNLFYNQVLQASTTVSTSQTDNVAKIVSFIAAQLDQDYNVSFAVVSNTDMASLIISTYTKGYYPGAGGVSLTANGISIFGVPVVPASWATTGEVLLIDNDFIERVQVEGLNIQLSYENSTNFEKNLVTARIECQEEINLMLSTAAAHGVLA